MVIQGPDNGLINLPDSIEELEHGGFDTLILETNRSGVTAFTLPEIAVEKLILFTSNDRNGQSNIFRGNSLDNEIHGSAGDSTRIYGGLGNDILYAAGLDLLYGEEGNDLLYGNGSYDRLYGGSGNDLLDGGLSADLMDGGSGDDHYIIDDAGDSVVELADAGLDTVTASISHELAENVEKLIPVGMQTPAPSVIR